MTTSQRCQKQTILSNAPEPRTENTIVGANGTAFNNQHEHSE